jgi:dihydroorotate dehydrogenase
MNIYISPPFGTYLTVPGCISVKGTFTPYRRRGLIPQVLRTVRKVDGGWINKIGLRNPGINSIPLEDFDTDVVYSIASLDENWSQFLRIPAHIAVELNVSCPNTKEYGLSNEWLEVFINRWEDLCIKLPPTATRSQVVDLYDMGMRRVHLSNTLGTPKGGISGYQQKEINLPLVESVANLMLEDLHITAGGGIYTLQDAKDYINAGADSLSLSSVWFNPLKGYRLVTQIQSLPK